MKYTLNKPIEIQLKYIHRRRTRLFKLNLGVTVRSFLLIPSSSSFISASMEGLKSRFGGESKEKSPLEAGRDALDVFGD